MANLVSALALGTRPALSTRRSLLPSRPAPTRAVPLEPETGKTVSLDAQQLISMARVGSATVSPDGILAVFEVKEYDFAEKKFDQQLWLMDLAAAETASDEELREHKHLTLLTSGAQQKFTSVSSPVFSPCGQFVAFLSDRTNETTAVWAIPVRGPGEARLLKMFPLSVSDLTWSAATGGIIVSASVYVDVAAAEAGGDAMAATAKRDKALEDGNKKLGGLNAVLFKRLPVREWDRWLDAKMKHPFFLPVKPAAAGGGYVAEDGAAVDLLLGAPTAVPSGAFGGSEDWALSSRGTPRSWVT
jgi:dipeptidyl aminopeptidase/acylaminoacyl peptidase